jgi:hypothetical protein
MFESLFQGLLCKFLFQGIEGQIPFSRDLGLLGLEIAFFKAFLAWSSTNWPTASANDQKAGPSWSLPQALIG